MSNFIQTGLPDTFPVRIFETGVNAVSAGTPGGGWVSGNPASLAASASVTCIFDLGQDWHQFVAVAIGILLSGTSTGFNAVRVSSSDTSTINPARRLKDISQAGINQLNATVTTSEGAHQVNVRPVGRYLFVALTNADATNAQDANARVTIAAYPS
jgi:hypothetical protein